MRKFWLHAAQAVFHAGEGTKFGYILESAPHVNFAAVMTRVREMRTASSGASVVGAAAAGIDVFLGSGRFVGADAAEVDGQQLKFKKALIATGGHLVISPIPGLVDAAYLTNETVFELTEMP